MTKRLFYVAQYFSPEPYLKDIDFIKSLQDKGWDPIVVTGFPNYPKGKIYSRYKNSFIKIEHIDGIQIIRTFTYSDHSLNAFKRILNYLVFSLMSSLIIIFWGKRKSLYYILQSSPFVVLIAWTIRLFKWNSKIVLDIQDIFPENIKVSGILKSKLILKILDVLLNKFYYKSFDFFITVSKSFKKIVTGKGIRESNILTLYNWSLIENSNNSESYNFNKNYFNIVYAGNIGVHQGLSSLIDAYKVIQNSLPNIRFHFFGDGTDMVALEQKLEEENVKNVELHGRVSSQEIYKYLKASDSLFLHLIDEPIYESIIPSKLQAYVEVGKPILGGVRGEAADLILENKLGEVFQSEKCNDMVSAVHKISSYDLNLIEAISSRSSELYSNEFSRKAGVNKLDVFLKQKAIYNDN